MINSLKKARLLCDIKQIDVANMLGCTPSMISLIEKGERLPTLEKAQKMCEIYGISGVDKDNLIRGMFKDCKNNLSLISSSLVDSIHKLNKLLSDDSLEINQRIVINEVIKILETTDGTISYKGKKPL